LVEGSPCSLGRPGDALSCLSAGANPRAALAALDTASSFSVGSRSWLGTFARPFSILGLHGG